MTQFKVGSGVFKLSLDKALTLAKDGDTLCLSAGKYHIDTKLQKAITIEADDGRSDAVIISGNIRLSDTSCVFKNITFVCSEFDDSVITATRCHLMFEHCRFHGSRAKEARALLLSQSHCTIYGGAFLRLTSNAIKAGLNSNILIYHSVFQEFTVSSAIYLDNSKLNVQNSNFLKLTNNAINAIGDCQVQARDCDWHVSQAPALYLNPKVQADISQSRFFTKQTAIFARSAAIRLTSCEFHDAKSVANQDVLNQENLIKDALNQDRPKNLSLSMPLYEHLFQDEDYTAAIELKDAKLSLTDSSFLALTIHTIEAIGQSQIDAARCFWQQDSAPVLFLYPNAKALLKECQIYGKSAIICTQNAQLKAERCQFSGIEQNHSIRAKQDSQLTILECQFDAIANFSALSIEDSRLDLQQSQFSNIKALSLEVKGDSQLQASGCTWQADYMAAIRLYADKINSEVCAQITGSQFLGRHSQISAQQSALSLKDCQFLGTCHDFCIQAIQHSRVRMTHCHFQPKQALSILDISAFSQISVSCCQFTGSPVAATIGAQSSLELKDERSLLNSEAITKSAIVMLDGGAVISPSKVALSRQKNDANLELKQKAEPKPKPDKTHLPQSSVIDACLQQLDGLVGLDGVKDEIRKIIARVNFQQRRAAQNIPAPKISLNMVFSGGYGTGKSTVAQIVADIFYQLGLLASSNVVTIQPSEVIGDSLCQTEMLMTQKIQDALDGILMIDEAHTFLAVDGSNQQFYAKALSVLTQEMSRQQHQLAVIITGRAADLQQLLKRHRDFAAKFTRHIEFEDFNSQQMLKIFENACHHDHITISPNANRTLKQAIDVLYARQDDRYSNAKAVKRLFEQTCEALSLRVLAADRDDFSLSAADIRKACKALEINIDDIDADRKKLFDEGMEELTELIGIDGVCSKIKSLVRVLQAQKRIEKSGVPLELQNLNLVFLGNIGTKKTVVANILAKIYYGLGVLDSWQLTQLDLSDLIGKAFAIERIHELFNEAIDGVLIIQDAQLLLKNHELGSAIQALLTDKLLIDNKSQKRAVILSGYQTETLSWLNHNPKVDELFPKRLEFLDLSPDDLLQIFERFCQKHSYRLTPIARQKVQFALSSFDQSADIGLKMGLKNYHLAQALFEQSQALHLARLKQGQSLLFDVLDHEDIPDDIEMTSTQNHRLLA